MEGVHNDMPLVVFNARTARLIFAELWSAAVAIVVIGAVLGVFRDFSRAWLIGTVVASLIAIILSGTLFKRSLRIIIGDSWIEGPTGQYFGTATIQFDTMDRARSGIKRGRLRIVSISGRGIEAKAAWYAPEDLEELERLLRDRAGNA
jgi:hypothetical protein